MNRLKPVFITLYITFLVIAIFYCAVQYFIHDCQLIWLTSFLACGLPLSFFAIIFLNKPKSTASLQVILSATTAASALITIGDRFFNSAMFDSAVWIALTGLLGWILYNAWYAKLNSSFELKIGDALPLLDLKQADGSPYDPLKDKSEFKLLVFHRGNWCPFCVAQINELEESSDLINNEKLAVYAISPVPLKYAMSMEQSLSGNLKILADPNNQVIRSLGIQHESSLPLGLQFFGFRSELVFPTSILLNSQNRILFVHQSKDYRNRPNAAFWNRIIVSQS
ncbi:MAG: peroxiredoxin [Litorivivens sp.]|jgi:peroxiredoxin